MSDDEGQTRESLEKRCESRSTDLISRGSSGIVPKNLLLLTFELRTADVLADSNHLLHCISDRYEQLSCFSRANDFIKVFSMVYDPNQNPAGLREKLLAKIMRFSLINTL